MSDKPQLIDPDKILAEKLLVKKERVLAAVSSGLELRKAFIIASVTKDEETKLLADEEFAARIEYSLISDELTALELHKTAQLIAVKKGNATPTQWYLEQVSWGGRFGKLGKPDEQDKEIVHIGKPDWLP